MSNAAPDARAVPAAAPVMFVLTAVFMRGLLLGAWAVMAGVYRLCGGGLRRVGAGATA